MPLVHHTAKVTEDRRLELPQEVQQELDLVPGQEIEIQLERLMTPVPNEGALETCAPSQRLSP